MIKIIIQNLIKDIKSYYLKLLVLFLPLFLVYYFIHDIIDSFHLSHTITRFIGYFFETLVLQFIIIISLLLIHQLRLKKVNTLAAAEKALLAVFKDLLKNITGLLRISSLKLILIFAGTAALILPGFHLSVIWFLVYPLFLFNKSKHPFKESLELADKYVFSLYGLLILYYLIFLIIPGLIIEIFHVLPYNYQKTFYFSSLLVIPVFCLLQYGVYTFITGKRKK